MRRVRWVRGAAAAAGTLLAAGVLVAQSAVAPTASPDFSRDVMPIFESNCLRCHNSAEEKGGLLLESYEDLMRGGDDGVPVVAGNADDSPMIRQVEARAKKAKGRTQPAPAAGNGNGEASLPPAVPGVFRFSGD